MHDDVEVTMKESEAFRVILRALQLRLFIPVARTRAADAAAVLI
jgi:hypothetical protein